MPLIIVVCYAFTLLYSVRFNLPSLLIAYWEYTAVYVVVATVTGLSIIRYFRGDEARRHELTVTMKWALRLIAAAVIYNSMASPQYSLVSLSVLVVFYIIYFAQKSIGNLFKGKVDGRKKSKAKKEE